jgi:hypothetical protein
MSDDGNGCGTGGFVGMVARMRVAQKRWNRYNDVKSHELAKQLEYQVDRWIDRETSPRVRPARCDRPEGGQR